MNNRKNGDVFKCLDEEGKKEKVIYAAFRKREREGSLIRNFMQDLHLTVGDSSLTRKNDEKEEGGASGLSHFLKFSQTPPIHISI